MHFLHFHQIKNYIDFKIPKKSQLFAYFSVNYFAFLIASDSFFIQCSAHSLFNGSSGFGDPSRAYRLNSTDLIYKAGLHFFLRISRQILPSRSMLGW